MKIDKIYWLPDIRTCREILPDDIKLILREVYKFTLVEREGELILIISIYSDEIKYHALLLAKCAALLGWVSKEEAKRYSSYCLQDEEHIDYERARDWQEANLEVLGGGVRRKSLIGPTTYEWRSGLYGSLEGEHLELVKTLFLTP